MSKTSLFASSLESSPDYDKILHLIKSAFTIFDSEKKGCIDFRNAATVIRYLGLVPTEADLQEFCSEVEDQEHDGEIFYDKFLPALLSRLEEKKFFPASYDELVRAFKFLDEEGKGYLTKEQLTSFMSENGEAFEEDEINEMLLAAVDKERGVIDYSEYVSWMIGDDDVGVKLRGYIEKHFRRLEDEAEAERIATAERAAAEAEEAAANQPPKWPLGFN